MSDLKKVHVALDDEYHAQLKHLAQLQGIPLGTLARGLVENQRDMVSAVIKSLEDLKAGRSAEDVEKDYLATMARLVINEAKSM